MHSSRARTLQIAFILLIVTIAFDIASRWYCLGYVRSHGSYMSLGIGYLRFTQVTQQNASIVYRTGWHVTEVGASGSWWFEPILPGLATSTRSLAVPLFCVWVPIACFAVFRAIGMRRDQSHSVDCAVCRYDRMGLSAGARCPECGSQPRMNGSMVATNVDAEARASGRCGKTN